MADLVSKMNNRSFYKKKIGANLPEVATVLLFVIYLLFVNKIESELFVDNVELCFCCKKKTKF